MIEQRPLPDVSMEYERPFWEAALSRRLLIQVCGACGEMRFPPRPMCPRCHCMEIEWKEACGRGRIWSWVVPHPPLLPAFESLLPYVVGLVTLEENDALRMVGRILPVRGEEVEPEILDINAPVTVDFERLTDDTALPCWRLGAGG